MNQREKIMVLQRQADELTIENLKLRETVALNENAALKADAATVAQKLSADSMYVSMIRRRAAALALKGQHFEALITLKKIGE